MAVVVTVAEGYPGHLLVVESASLYLVPMYAPRCAMGMGHRRYYGTQKRVVFPCNLLQSIRLEEWNLRLATFKIVLLEFRCFESLTREYEVRIKFGREFRSISRSHEYYLDPCPSAKWSVGSVGGFSRLFRGASVPGVAGAEQWTTSRSCTLMT